MGYLARQFVRTVLRGFYLRFSCGFACMYFCFLCVTVGVILGFKGCQRAIIALLITECSAIGTLHFNIALGIAQRLVFNKLGSQGF